MTPILASRLPIATRRLPDEREPCADCRQRGGEARRCRWWIKVQMDALSKDEAIAGAGRCRVGSAPASRRRRQCAISPRGLIQINDSAAA